MEMVSYLLVVVYVFSFFALGAVAAREARRPVWLFGAGGRAQAIPANLFRFAFAGAIVLPLLRAFGVPPFANDPLRAALDGTAGDILGHLLVALGACVAIVSQIHMGASWRVGAVEGEIGGLVTNGPFAVSRNPVFVGQALLFVGLFLVLPGAAQALATLALFLAILLQVRIEERVLAATFGDAWRDYAAKVRRWA